MSGPAHARDYETSWGNTSSYFKRDPLEPENPPAPFAERFPVSSNFALDTALSSSSTRASNLSELARGVKGGAGAGAGGSAIEPGRPPSTSNSTWDSVERLLGEEGRGQSPSRNGARSCTPSRSSSQMSQWSRAENDAFGESGRQPSTPKPTSGGSPDDHDTTPKGMSRQAIRQTSGDQRPLHTPPQLLPPAASALRPPSAQSHSSNSSTYSLDDTSWAAALAPPLLDDGFRHAQARPLSEFDFAAAYARSDGGGSLPSSPMMPTVGFVQPASPVTAERFEPPSQPGPNGLSTSSPNELGPGGSLDASGSNCHSSAASLLPTQVVTPASSRAPSPTPSLSPNARPSSRASSSRSVSSPVRPPRRQASHLSLAPKPDAVSTGREQTPSPASSSSSSAMASIPIRRDIPTSTLPSKTISHANAASPSLPSRSAGTAVSPQGSPRPPPNIPEKSRRRASTLGLGLRRGDAHDRDESREIGDGSPGPTPEPGPSERNMISAFSNPDTPLSASDFADVYGKLDTEWDARSTTSSHGPSFGSASNSTSPVSTRSKPLSQAPRVGSPAEDVFLDADGGAPPSPATRDSKVAASSTVSAESRVLGNSANDPATVSPRMTAASTTSPSTISKGDARARAAAFIADLKKSRQEAGTEGGETGRSPGESPRRRNSVHDRLGKDDTAAIAPSLSDARCALTQHESLGTGSSSRYQPEPHHVHSSRSSATPVTSRAQPRLSQSPLLRRRPLPMAIQASGELQKARSAGDRARIYAVKINELSREASRLDEWMDMVRNPRLAVARAAATSPTASPIRTSRSFRHDGSSATFAPRGDGYRAREIVSATFAAHDLQPSAPFPGVLAYHSNSSNGASSISVASQQRPLGSGLPAASVGFFSRSLGRRASKRAPTPGSAFQSVSSGSGGGGVGHLPISNPRAIAGPRMPSPLLPYSVPSSTPAALDTPPVDQAALERLADVLPQASKEDLCRCLKKAGGSDDVLAISIYLSEREASIGK